jgi:hypothetical protein
VRDDPRRCEQLAELDRRSVRKRRRGLGTAFGRKAVRTDGQRAARLPGRHRRGHRPATPEVEVRTVEPAALEGSISCFSPEMVVCSKATDALKGRVRVWVELYPEHAAHSVASIGGKTTEYAEIQLPDLLSIVNRAEELAQAN